MAQSLSVNHVLTLQIAIKVATEKETTKHGLRNSDTMTACYAAVL